MIDRSDLKGNHFLALANFGDHIMHHLFPTLDHGCLAQLYPILYETVDEFKVELREKSYPSLIVGQHLQLIRTDPSTRCRDQEEMLTNSKNK